MLLNTLFFVALLTVATFTFLSAGLAMTRMTAARMVQTYVTTGYQHAAASLERTIANEIQSGGLPDPLPSFTPLPAVCAGTGCAYKTMASIAVSKIGSPAGAQCDASQSNCAANEQANPHVDETRVFARISVTVTTADGTPVAMRADDLVLRTIAVPPYVLPAGARDDTFAAAPADDSPGDDGGVPAATPNPCARATPGAADDTSIRVAYRNAATNACTDGSSWRSSPYTVRGAAPSGWSP